MKGVTIVRYRWQTIISIVLFCMAVLGNFIIITFGNDIKSVRKISNKVRKEAQSQSMTVEDIGTIRSLTNIPMDTDYYLNVYIKNGPTQGLRFESLNPEVFTLPNGKVSSLVHSAVFDDDLPHEGVLRVTSIYDKNFTKDLTLSFNKRYLATFKPTINRIGAYDSGSKSYKAYVDCEFYFYYPFETYTTERKVEAEYDTEFFEHRNMYTFKPLKTGTTTITLKYYDRGTVTYTINIVDVSMFDYNNILFYTYPWGAAVKNDELVMGSRYYLLPAQDSTKRFLIHEIEISDTSILSISSNYVLSPKKEGEVDVTIRSAYGDAVTKRVKVIKQAEVYEPLLTGTKYRDDDNDKQLNFEIDTTYRATISYKLSKALQDVTLLYDEDFMEASYVARETYGVLVVKTKKLGTSPITFVYREGEEDEESFTFLISSTEKSTSIFKNLTEYYHKGLSHCALFFIVGIGAMLMLVYVLYNMKHWLRAVLGLGFGLFLGGLEEFIQIFIPNRTPSAKDVFFYDWLFYIMGALITMVVIVLSYTIINKKKKEY